MTRTSRRHTSSICQNNRREADPYSQNFVAAISRYVNTCRGTSAHPHDFKAFKHTDQSCSTATGPALSVYLISFYDLHARMAQSQEADSINDWIAERADSIIIKAMKRDVMGQIAFACNRRNNAMQHRNGLMTLACGANDRLTTFLYDCGLTTSRWATLQAAASLTKANSTKLKEIGSNKYFHVTVDNIDVTHHVNDQQLDRRTELLHGTFGYAHIQNGDIANAYNLRAYSAHQASLPRVNLQHLLPTSQSDSSFTTGIKAQIYRALARLVPHLGLSPTSICFK
ncbi:BQ5605_C005g03382 [Microbotryum silenes-dioicae]|uniref:BQ5605_C005g03382 protein n=1 Tax=Microbotryum silenes-dioicae TaxID=796604 RepID=A0A2X0MAN2_9BASI|nr:BQ5605_C005g03382 [Microbotryum silenes-dioicae]